MKFRLRPFLFLNNFEKSLNSVLIYNNMTGAMQVKSKQRVADHGEVFTSEREVNAMLDLVKQETERIDSRFLEPACGDGNFLAEILSRKLDVVQRKYKNNQFEYERYGFLAIGSIYGIDILQDNVKSCRERLFLIFLHQYRKLFGEEINEQYLESIKYVLFRNIIWGDALSLETVGMMKEPIVFSEWTLVMQDQIKRRDFNFVALLNNFSSGEPNLFSDLGDDAFIPKPVKTYPLQSIYNLAEDVQNKL